MRIALVGPGRAGTAIALGMSRAGHQIVAVSGRDQARAEGAAARFGSTVTKIGEPVGDVDLVIVAVRDDAIATVARELSPAVEGAGGAVHLSGATSVEALSPIAAVGVPTGSFHPLQTMPSPEAGADRLDGAWIAITAAPPLRQTLHTLAESLGAQPFDLDDADKALYHAAAAAAANFPLAALAISHELFEAAGVPFDAAKPLVEAAVANAFEGEPSGSLTGPVARGDTDTVTAQLAAIDGIAPQWRDAYRALISATAEVAGTADQFKDLV